MITVEGIDRARLNEVERNALAVLENMDAEDLGRLKRIMLLGAPVVIGPATLDRFLRLAIARGVDLTNGGVVSFKTAHRLTGGAAIGRTTAGAYVAALGLCDRASGHTGRTINAAGLRLVQSFEGCHLAAYLCPAGAPTIGWGHTGGVRLGDHITQEMADALLRKDLGAFEAAVARFVAVPLTDNQFAALVSFAFNCGAGALEMSTLRRRLNVGDYRGAADEFLRWDRAGGGVMPGLTRRRKAERALFLTP